MLWEKDGSPTDLGNLGDPYNVASTINNRGEVVGGALSPKDGTIHAFLWTKHTCMQDFGAFPGAIVTVPPCCSTVTDRGDMVGFAIDGTTFTSRALIWQDKIPVDLNTLIPANSGWYLQAASSINNAGEIVGYGLINGKSHAFLATPPVTGIADAELRNDDRTAAERDESAETGGSGCVDINAVARALVGRGRKLP